MNMRVRVLKWGNSLAVRFPKPVAEDANFEVGDSLEIAVRADGVVQLHRLGAMPALAQMVVRITPENRYDEVSCGAEIVEW
jgi:antitoxin MazE